MGRKLAVLFVVVMMLMTIAACVPDSGADNVAVDNAAAEQAEYNACMNARRSNCGERP